MIRNYKTKCALIIAVIIMLLIAILLNVATALNFLIK